MMSDNVTKTGEFFRGLSAPLVVDLEGHSLKCGKGKPGECRLEKVKKGLRQWAGVIIDGPGVAVERKELQASGMDLDDPFQGKSSKPGKNRRSVDGAP